MRVKRTRRSTWILRGALATLGLAGAVYAADQVTEPPPEDVGKTITAQRVKAGSLANQQETANQKVKLTAEQMIEVAGTYDSASKAAYEHAETLRMEAYRQRDIIRMTCIDDKITQMKQIMNVVAPRLLALPNLTSDDLVMRQHFLVVQQGHNRVLELATEIEECMGDNLARVSFGRIKEETPTVDVVFDPTRPPSPDHAIERPGEASPYR